LKKQKNKYCHYRKDDEKEIQKADGMGYYSSILNMYIQGNHIKTKLWKLPLYIKHANIKRL
jgi:hypothetical protein